MPSKHCREKIWQWRNNFKKKEESRVKVRDTTIITKTKIATIIMDTIPKTKVATMSITKTKVATMSVTKTKFASVTKTKFASVTKTKVVTMSIT